MLQASAMGLSACEKSGAWHRVSECEAHMPASKQRH